MTWWERIDAAEKRGSFTRRDMLLAGNWITCACGEQDLRIPRCDSCKPADDRLAELGQMFYNSVGNNNVRQARKTLTLIEKRAAKLLKKVQA